MRLLPMPARFRPPRAVGVAALTFLVLTTVPAAAQALPFVGGDGAGTASRRRRWRRGRDPGSARRRGEGCPGHGGAGHGGPVTAAAVAAVVLGALYGVGMAAALVSLGVVLVSSRVRLERRLDRIGSARLHSLTAALPAVTAACVLLGGLGLVARAVLAA